MAIRFNKEFSTTHKNFELNQSNRGCRERIKAVFAKFNDILNSIKSYRGKVSVTSETEAHVEKATSHLYGPAAIKKLKCMRRLAPSTIQAVCEGLFAKSDQVEWNSSFLFNDANPNLPPIKDGTNLLFIPVVLNGRLGSDHIVAVVYDKVNNRIELFDSKGLTSLDHSERVRSKQHLRLADVLALVAHTYGNTETTVVENTTKVQHDSHNCGVYVLDYFERRSQGHEMETIANQQPLSFQDANQAKREHFLRNLPTNSDEPSAGSPSPSLEDDGFLIS